MKNPSAETQRHELHKPQTGLPFGAGLRGKLQLDRVFGDKDITVIRLYTLRGLANMSLWQSPRPRLPRATPHVSADTNAADDRSLLGPNAPWKALAIAVTVCATLTGLWLLQTPTSPTA